MYTHHSEIHHSLVCCGQSPSAISWSVTCLCIPGEISSSWKIIYVFRVRFPAHERSYIYSCGMFSGWGVVISNVWLVYVFRGRIWQGEMLLSSMFGISMCFGWVLQLMKPFRTVQVQPLPHTVSDNAHTLYSLCAILSCGLVWLRIENACRRKWLIRWPTFQDLLLTRFSIDTIILKPQKK